MKTRFQPLPDGEPPLTIPQFLARLRHEPGFAETMQAHYESMLVVPKTPLTATMRKKAAEALRTLRHHQGAWKAKQCLLQGQALMVDDGFLDDPAIHGRIAALTTEARDHLLDVLEPERTRLMASIAEVRKMLKALQPPG